MTSDLDTVFAIATGAGRAALAVLRISGPASGAALRALCGKIPTPRRASVRLLKDALGLPLDRALVLWLPGPASYTGEDSVELHLHGGRAVIADVSEALVTLGLRPAEPGEFSRRAFINGRMDLIEAEGAADLVAAETAAQRRQALRQLDGAVGTLLHGWAAMLIGMAARQEALIDFPDEELPPEIAAAMLHELASLRDAMRRHLDDGRRGERLREGLVFAIAGPPNAGKSTLINAITQRDVAIVSPLPGTTRDVLEARIELGGVPVTLLDTAGLRDTDDQVEAEGVRRTLARLADADLVIHLTEAGQMPAATLPSHRLVLHVATKIDLVVSTAAYSMSISAVTGEGIDQLLEVLASHARALTQAEGPPPLTRARHRAALLEAAGRLDAAIAAVLPELMAEDIRLALRALGRITGRVGVEDILDSVFRQFCIGK